ncbi:PspC domain-containing protein [Actinomycetospora soli]|uniref:PspC domain-containing protein n=1 Tax=Actinomycetospora soli TaxID=2893887 RepID=UPI001E2A967C|nr:PspC domain-containing protein [Actinomycetospora soli]MCD2189393.1 PspC domain-containing protein [Actinomycetospora soli]
MSGATTKDGTDLAAVARAAWDTRPARRREDAKIAGVAGAVARRYDLDPTLVRVAVVVWAIVGGGLLLYLLGWLVLPADPADPPSHDRSAHRDRGSPVLLIVITAVVGIATIGNATDGRWVTFVALVLAAVTLYLLHTARADLGVPGTPGVPSAAAVTADLGEPVAWDALGADPKAWAYPAPTRRPEPVGPVAREPRRRGVLTPVTLALALLAAGLAAVGVLLGVPGVTGVWIPAAALAVVGLGLLVAGVRGRPRRGLVFVAIPLVLATVFGAYAATRPDDSDFVGDQRGLGDLVATPLTTAQVLPGYRTGFGDVTVDLSQVAPGPPVRTTVESGAGDITVTVPATADVTVTCTNGVGDVDCLGRSGNAVTSLVDPGPDGPGGQVVDLTVRNGAGDLAVRRG